VIVVNDGSKDNLASIVKEYPVQLISTPNRGLSNARNTGMKAAKGEIVAYIDDDAYPDPQWLHYLAYAYETSDHGGMGGPNICPEEDGPIAKCVANSPGGPVHVLVTDEIAEHVPGCNLSFRREALLEVGGFDPIYRSAGDDVDVCWRIQATGKTIGFHPSALVWHHRRNSIKAYWKQQKGYGKAEALLEGKWPEKYNGMGHLAWAGRIYGNGFTLPIKVKKDKIFHGTWGTALFQSVYQPADGFINALPLMPEWYLFSALLGLTATLGFLWAPLLLVWPLFILSVVVMLVQASISAVRNVSLHPNDKKDIRFTALITLLHLIQPVARLTGRLNHGLTPWRTRASAFHTRFLFSFGKQNFTNWSEEWKGAETWLRDMESKLISLQARVSRGGDFDNWDMQAKNGIFAVTRALLTIEEHGANKQLLRLRSWSSPSSVFYILVVMLFSISGFALADKAYLVASIFGFAGLMIVVEYIKGSVSGMCNFYNSFKSLDTAAKVIPVATEEPLEQPLLVPETVYESIYLHPELIKSKVIIQGQEHIHIM
jgi:GT2 family glycosyltransferase